MRTNLTLWTVWALVGAFGLQGMDSRTGNWRQFRGPNRDNRSPDSGLLKQWQPGGPPLLWKASAASR